MRLSSPERTKYAPDIELNRLVTDLTGYQH